MQDTLKNLKTITKKWYVNTVLKIAIKLNGGKNG